MHRLYVPPEAVVGDVFVLPDPEARHAHQVLRLGVGDSVTLIDGCGGERRCRLESVSRRETTVRVLEHTRHARPECAITLLQGLTKGRSFDLILQKAVELGAARVVPVLAERSVVRLEPAEAEEKRGKWRLTATEALKQCGRTWLPEIDLPSDAEGALPLARRSELVLVASLRSGARHPRQVFDEFQLRQGRMPTSVSVWVGPEGDFTGTELDRIEAGGGVPIELGSAVLRSETAALYCLAILAYEMSRPAV